MAEVEIIVIGDVYWDTVIVPLPSDQGAERPENAYVRMDRPAGALLLEAIIRKASKSDNTIDVKGYIKASQCDKDSDIETLRALRENQHLKPDEWGRALSVMGLYPKSDKEDKEVYRIRPKERLGWVAYPGAGGLSWTKKQQTKLDEVYNNLNSAVSPDTEPKHRIVVISETEKHPFRNLEKNVEFVKNIANSETSYLVFCMAHPLGKGQLWNMVKKNKQLVDRTLVVISAASLRAGELYVREQAAQETIALELARKFEKPEIQDLNTCPHIVVRFDYDSVFHYDTRKKYCANDTGQGCFDNYLRPFEGGPQTNPGRYGTMSGYGKILVASVVQEMAKEIKTGDPFGRLGKGICDGLRRGAAHFRNGFAAAKGFETAYLEEGSEPTPFEDLFNNSSSTPIKELFRQKVDVNGVLTPQLDKDVKLPLLAKVHMPCDDQRLETWSRVEGLEKEINDKKIFEKCLVNVVKIGLEKALEKHKTNVSQLSEDEWPVACPFLKLGALISIERTELDGFNDVYVLIQKYLQDDTSKKPLSLAVFGPPGTGKSFAVQEIMKAAKSPSGKWATDILENNLSQFTEPKNLARAFHRAQDVALSGKVPLVFFDEFDASLPEHRYAWLKYFLAPMQDGKFKAADSEDSYTVGRAIFVFAGGTENTFDDFKKNAIGQKESKGPDFISRLRGYLNILSINDKMGEVSPRDKETSEAKPEAEPVEDCRLLLRRAILLRSVLEREANEIIDSKKQARIDDGVIKAFLRIGRYQHRMRSMEAIVKMARPDKGWFRVASLPSRDQLGMHVDAERFLELAQTRRTPPTPRIGTGPEKAEVDAVENL